MSIVIDIAFCLIAVLFFYLGYRKGFFFFFWWIIDLALIVVMFVLLSPSIMKWIEGSTGWKTSLSDKIAAMTANLPVEINAESVANFILKTGICVVLAIAIISVMAIIKFFLKKLITLKVFGVIDRILGGFYSVIVMFVILLLVGGILGTLINFVPIQKAHDLFAKSYMAKYVFGENLLQNFFNQYLPLGTWIGKLGSGGEESAMAALANL